MLKYLKQLAGESAIYGLSSILTRFITIFLVPIYTRVFSPADYGHISLVLTTFALLSLMVVLGLDSAAAIFYYDVEEEVHKKKPIANWFWTQLFSSSLITVLISIFSKPLSFLLFNTSQYWLVLIIAAVNLIFSTFNTILINWLRLKRKPIHTMVFSLTSSLLTISLNIFFVVYLKAGIIGVFYAAACSSLIFSIVSILLMREWLWPTHFEWELLTKMLQFSLPLVPAALAYWISNSSASYFLNYTLTKEDVGLFQIGASLASGMLLFTGAFQMALGPFVFSLSKNENSKELYANILLGYIIITSFLFLALSSFSFEILIILTREVYYSARYVGSILALNFIFLGLNYIGSIGLNLAKDNKPYMYAVFIAAGINVILFYVLIPVWGKEGAALSMTLSTFISSGYIFYASQKRYPIPYSFKSCTIILCFAILLALFLNTLTSDNLLFMILVKGSCLIAYILVMFLCIKRYILKKPLLPLLKLS
jgi:O-antigen/teichoic acid export membrane protein